MVWAEWFERNNRVLAKDQTKFFAISTIFLGLDHNWIDGPPLLFETMIFEREAKIREFLDRLMPVHETVDQIRYSTWDDAMTGHKTAFRRMLAREAKASKKANEIKKIRRVE